MPARPWHFRRIDPVEPGALAVALTSQGIAIVDVLDVAPDPGLPLLPERGLETQEEQAGYAKEGEGQESEVFGAGGHASIMRGSGMEGKEDWR